MSQIVHDCMFDRSTLRMPAALPERVATLLVYVKADVVHMETGKVVPYPDVAEGWDGAAADLPLNTVPAGEAKLAFQPAARALRCVFAFELSEFPRDAEVTRLLDIVREKLTTAWGRNVSFGCRGNLTVQLGSKILAHRIETNQR